MLTTRLIVTALALGLGSALSGTVIAADVAPDAGASAPKSTSEPVSAQDALILKISNIQGDGATRIEELERMLAFAQKSNDQERMASLRQTIADVKSRQESEIRKLREEYGDRAVALANRTLTERRMNDRLTAERAKRATELTDQELRAQQQRRERTNQEMEQARRQSIEQAKRARELKDARDAQERARRERVSAPDQRTPPARSAPKATPPTRTAPPPARSAPKTTPPTRSAPPTRPAPPHGR